MVRHSTSGHHLLLSLALVLTLAGAITLWLASFSAPFLNRVYYLRTIDGGAGSKLGTFGFCAVGSGGNDGACSGKHIGYSFHDVPAGKKLTGSLILTPNAAGLASLAVFTLMHSIKWIKSVLGSLILTICAMLIAVISFILALITFVTAHKRYSNEGTDPHYGSAIWLHLVGTICLIAAIPLIMIGWLTRTHGTRTTVTSTSYRA